MKIQLREIQSGDNKALAAVIRTVLEEHGVNRPGTVYTDPTTDALYELFRTENSYYLVVLIDGEIVGGCGIYPTKNLPEGCTELVKLYLLKQARGLGLGKQLMEAVIAKASALNYSQVYLESMPELNKAIGLYEELGFKKINHALGDSGHHACDVWMVLTL